MSNSQLATDIRACSRLTGNFVLRSGKHASTYFDKYRFEAQPELLRRICEALVPLVPADTQVLAGMEMGGLPVVTVLSQLTGLPCAFVRKKAKTHGTCRYAEGADLDGPVTLVEDVVSSGGAILDALDKLNADAVFPTTALCVIDRQSGGAEGLAERGVELRALLTMAELEAES